MKGKLLISILSIALVGLLATWSCQRTSPHDITPPPSDTSTPETLDGKISNVTLPSSVEGIESFHISVEVENTGDVEATFDLSLSALWLEFYASTPAEKYMASGESETFDILASAIYTAEPETTTSLSVQLYANEKLVDTRTASLMIFMSQLKFSGYKASSEGFWDRVINLTLEIKNEGRASAQSIIIFADLLREDGTVRDSANEHFSYLAPGATHQVSVILDGEVGNRYRIFIRVKDALGSGDIMTSEYFTLQPNIPWELIFSLLPYLLP